MPIIFKPRTLGISTRPVARQAGSAFVISIYGLAALDAPDADRLLADQGIWPAALAELPDGAMWDVGLPKPWAEFMVAGHAMAPGGVPVPALELNIRFAGRQKSVSAFGDRHWVAGGAGHVFSAPTPFTALKFGPDRAFGGAGIAANLLGRGGNARNRLARQEPVHLPNFEAAGALLRNVDDQPVPVVLGPGDPADPERIKLAGTHDAAWLKDDAPGFARDIDPRFFCLAPQDQWLSGYLRGDESFSFSGFSATQPRLSGQLPGFLARAFVAFENQPDRLFETAARLDTVLFLPSLAKAVLVWRTVVECSHREADDLRAVMIAYDRLEAPRDAAHYQEVFALRSDPEKGANYAFSEHQLTPSLSMATLNSRFKAREAYREAETARRQAAQQIILDESFLASGLPPGFRTNAPPVEPLPDFLPTPEEIAGGDFDLADILDGAEQLAQKTLATAEAEMARMAPVIAQAEAFAKTPTLGGLDAMLEALQSQTGETMPRLATLVDETAAAVQTPESAAQAQPEIETLLERLKGPLVVELDDEIRFVEARDRFLGRPEAGPMGPAREALAGFPVQMISNAARAEISAAHNGAAPPPVPLAELLRGIAMPAEDSLPEVAKAQAAMRSDLEKAEPALAKAFPHLAPQNGQSNLEAMLGALQSLDPTPKARTIEDTESAIQEAIAAARRDLDASEPSALEGLAAARRASPEPISPPLAHDGVAGRRFGAFILERKGAGEPLRGRDFAGAHLAGADFSHQDLTGAFFEGANLSNAKFVAATCTDAVFTGALLDGADFTGADLRRANLSGITGTGMVLAGAQLLAPMLIRSKLAGANLFGARLNDANLFEVDLTGASLQGAELSNLAIIKSLADGLQAQEARFEQVSFLDTGLVAANFDRATLVRVVALNARAAGLSARYARFENTGFLGDSDLSGAQFDDTQLRGGSMRNARLAKASFRGAMAARFDLGGADLTSADFSLATLFQCVLSSCQARTIEGFGINLLGAQLRGADLTGARLRSANLYAADLTDAILVGADLSGANWQKTLLALATDAD